MMRHTISIRLSAPRARARRWAELDQRRRRRAAGRAERGAGAACRTSRASRRCQRRSRSGSSPSRLASPGSRQTRDLQRREDLSRVGDPPESSAGRRPGGGKRASASGTSALIPADGNGLVLKRLHGQEMWRLNL
ncbi:MAG: hypothetical protein F9K40_06165 [Kofleriaceae bacterium]|nr:MAG: hypothetical protein F9K40_06165 [Kofleriaceae bacterium]